MDLSGAHSPFGGVRKPHPWNWHRPRQAREVNGSPGIIHVAGLPVALMDREAALDTLWADIDVSRPRVYALVNAYSATLSRDSRYRSVLSDTATIPLADGIALSLGAYLTGQVRPKRCPGPDLLEYAAARAAADGTRFFLLGGGEGVASDLAVALQHRHPGLTIAGALAPPFGEWDDDLSQRLVRSSLDSEAQVVWLGVSAPKQEIWAGRWAEELGTPVVCVGAAFDFLSGRKPRAPRWMRRFGLEWLFRLLSEPMRLWKRYLHGNSLFLWDLLRFRSKPGMQ